MKYEIDAVALISRCVVAGLGVSLLPGGCLQHDPVCRELDARPFEEGGIRRLLVVCRPESGATSVVCEKLMSQIRAISRDLVDNGLWLGAQIER